VEEVADTGRLQDTVPGNPMDHRAVEDGWGTGQWMVGPRIEAVERRRSSVDHVRTSVDTHREMLECSSLWFDLIEVSASVKLTFVY
jgi:hypothetical protein